MLSSQDAKLLEDRGLDIELCTRMGFSSSTRFKGQCISIDYVEGGEVRNHKYRTLGGEKMFAQDKDARKIFWNIDCVADASLSNLPVIITEGEMDAIAAMQSGFSRVISVPDGAPSQEQGADDTGRKYSYVADALPMFQGVREIILAVDSDGPGVNLMNDLAVRFGKARCKWVKYPKDCKDLNDALMRYGQKGVVETINRAQWMRVDGVYRMSELPPMTHHDGLNTGVPGLEKHFKIRPGDLSVLTGIPGMGKTALVNAMAAGMVWFHKWPIGFASFEQLPQLDHRRNLRSLHAGRRVIDCSPAVLAEADAWIDRWFTFIVPGEDDIVSLEWTLERCAAAVVQNGVKWVVIDPWNEMDHDRPPDMTMTEYTGFAIRQFKAFARKYQVHVTVVAHPAKLKRENGKTPVPTLYDIADSAHWYNKPDAGLIVHRVDKDVTLVRVQKSRYHDQIGVPGDLNLRFDISNGQYFPYEGVVTAP